MACFCRNTFCPSPKLSFTFISFNLVIEHIEQENNTFSISRINIKSLKSSKLNLVVTFSFLSFKT